MNWKKIRRLVRIPLEVFGVLVVFTFCKVMPLVIIRFLGRFLGLLLFLVPDTRRLTLANLAIAFPEKSFWWYRKIAYLSVSNSISTLLEFMWSYRNKRRLNKILQLDKKTREFFQKNQSTLFMGLHIGNWEFSSLVLGLNSQNQVYSIAKKLRNPFLEKLIYKGRIFGGINLCHQEGAVKKFLTGLKKEQSVALIIDQNTALEQGGIFVNFFDLKVRTTKMPALLIKKYSPMVAFLIVLRTKKGFQVIMRECTPLFDKEESDELLTQQIMNIAQEFVQKYPEQWVWLYERWSAKISKDSPDYPYYAN